MFAADGGVAESSQSGTPQGEGVKLLHISHTLISNHVVVYDKALYSMLTLCQVYVYSTILIHH